MLLVTRTIHTRSNLQLDISFPHSKAAGTVLAVALVFITSAVCLAMARSEIKTDPARPTRGLEPRIGTRINQTVSTTASSVVRKREAGRTPASSSSDGTNQDDIIIADVLGLSPPKQRPMPVSRTSCVRGWRDHGTPGRNLRERLTMEAKLPKADSATRTDTRAHTHIYIYMVIAFSVTGDKAEECLMISDPRVGWAATHGACRRRNVRSTCRCIWYSCDSHTDTQFAAVFIDPRAK